MQHIIAFLQEKTQQSPKLMSLEIVSLYGKDPYLILISCILSLQTRDKVTLPVAIKLFDVARTPQQILQLSMVELEIIIKSINHYKTKARTIMNVSRVILEQFAGQVPATQEELLSLKGVGLKTANLVLAQAFDVPAICVDTHVHRLSNHWGLVGTQTPEQTEQELRTIIPQKYWITWSCLVVQWGQNICKTKRCGQSLCMEMIVLLKNWHLKN